jgi:hypothetical protein
MQRFDIRSFFLIFGAALTGAAWAIYNRSLVPSLPLQGQLRALTWVIFATPFATFWGWFFSRRAERLWAAAICCGIYFFTVFVAARYESCAVVWAEYGPAGCFIATGPARDLAGASKHAIYFQVIVILQILSALAVALHRALSRSRMPVQLSQPQGEPT